MFDIGFGEMLIIAAIALIAIGPKQLPEVARTLGRLMNEFKRATGEFTKTFTDTRDSTSNVFRDIQRSITHTPPPTSELAADMAEAQSGEHPVVHQESIDDVTAHHRDPYEAAHAANHKPEDQLAFHLDDFDQSYYDDIPETPGQPSRADEPQQAFPLQPSNFPKKDS